MHAKQDGGRYEQHGIVLVHGFGAGVFAWRHILQPLAQKCGCRVIAFDRPGFGASSRSCTSSHVFCLLAAILILLALRIMQLRSDEALSAVCGALGCPAAQHICGADCS